MFLKSTHAHTDDIFNVLTCLLFELNCLLFIYYIILLVVYIAIIIMIVQMKFLKIKLEISQWYDVELNSCDDRPKCVEVDDKRLKLQQLKPYEIQT